ncbi:MAG: GDP-mannose pyrophosphatase [Pseudomonadota bacterium]
MPIADRIKVIDSQTLADDWGVLKKNRIAWRRRDGTWQEMLRETYDRGNGAVILPYDPDRRTVLLVRQFRYPAWVNGADDLLIEAAAGLLDNAAPAERIRAEAQEELGLRLRDATEVFQAYMSPGSVTECLHFFVARYDATDRIGAGGGVKAEGEDIEVLEMDIDTALVAIADGRIQDAKTIMLLQHAALHLFGNSRA